MSQILTPELIAAELLARKRAEGSLYEFTRQAWELAEGARPFVPNWHLEALAEHLEAVMAGEIRNLLVNVPPRTLKSGLASVMLPPWVWIRNPHLQFLYVSYAQDLSVRDSVKGRRVIESGWYRNRWGDRFSITTDQNTKTRFDNNKGGYRLSSSVDAKITGEGGDVIVCDDPNNVKDRSEVMLKTAMDWWREVMPTRLNDFKTGRRIVIQQRMHERDITGLILSRDEGEWIKLILPMEFEPKRCAVTIKLPSTMDKVWADPRREEGELLFPARIGPKELKLLKRELGEFAVAGQLQQRPAPEAGGIIKRHWFRIWTATAPPKCDFTLMSIDTAVSEARYAAYNVATTWGVFRRAVDNSPTTQADMAVQVPNVILLSLWRKQCGYEQTRSMIQRLSKDYMDDRDEPRNSIRPLKPDVILIEAKSTGLAIRQDLSRAGIASWPYNPDKRGDKANRVHLVTPILSAGRVWLPGKPPDFYEPREWVEPFVHECLSFPNGATMDMVDTMSMALDHLSSFGFVWHPDDDRPEERTPEWSEEKAGEPAFY